MDKVCGVREREWSEAAIATVCCVCKDKVFVRVLFLNRDLGEGFNRGKGDKYLFLSSSSVDKGCKGMFGFSIAK